MIKRHQQSGMTLIEILVIVLIVSVGMIATAKFQGELLQVGGTTKARTQALALAQQEIENLRINHDISANGTEDDVVGVNTEYDRSWTVAVVAGAQQYKSSVTWTDSQNRTQSLQLNTVLYPDNMLSEKEGTRAGAANCMFDSSLCRIQPPPAPTATADIDISQEKKVAPLSKLPSDGNGLSPPNSIDKGVILTGENYLGSATGSTKFVEGTSGNDKLLVGSSQTANVPYSLKAGDDVMQINGELSGSASIDLGPGNDLLVIDSIGGSATIEGGEGTDTICFSKWSKADYVVKDNAIQNVEILLFNDGNHQFLNGYSTDESNLPSGCGRSLVYHYPINIPLVFPSEKLANIDGQATVENNTSNITLLESADLLVHYLDNLYHLYLSSVTAEACTVDSLGIRGCTVDKVGLFIKNISFTIESPTIILTKDQVIACATWTGADYKELEILVQDTACH